MPREPKNLSETGERTEETTPPSYSRTSEVDEQTDDATLDQISDLWFSRLASSSHSNVYFTNARDGLNLRSGPSTDFSIIKSLPLGTRVYLMRRQDQWGLIDEKGDGAADGFVHLAFLSQEETGFSLKSSGETEHFRAFLKLRNPRGARLYNGSGSPLVDPLLLHASALGIQKFELISQNHYVEIYGPSGGFRTSGSLANHGAQPGTGRGAALDFVVTDLNTGKWLTNHPGKDHQYQGTVGECAPIYQMLFNEIVRSGLQLDSAFADMARFGGYFRNGVNAIDTMHVDMRGRVVPMGAGSVKGGFTKYQIEKWNIPKNYPFK